MRIWILAAAIAAGAGSFASAAEPDGLILPPGFHASVVAEGLGPLRHLAFRANGDLYASTGGEGAKPEGLVAIRLGPDHKAVQVTHFSDVNGGTGIRFHDGMLYAASSDAISRFAFSGDELTPSAPPQVIVRGIPREGNHPIAFDHSGGLFVALGAKSNACVDTSRPKGAPPAGLTPCPDLVGGSGIWRFDAMKTDQSFDSGARFAGGFRFMTAMDWSPDAGLVGAMHGRDGTHRAWPDRVSAADDDNIGDEMDRIAKGTDFGWPYTYYDCARNVRLVAPEYGGDGKAEAPAGKYTTPDACFFPMRAAPVDIAFYEGAQFPRAWQGGAFVALHGTGGPPLPEGRNGYKVAFVPFGRDGKAGAIQTFADGFAGPSAADRNSGKAMYRPVGLAVAPDGSLYVADSNKGRIWRISYGG